MLLVMLVMTALAALYPGPELPWPAWLGWPALALGLVLNLWPKRAFRRAGTTVNPLHPERSQALVTGELHRISRNPMYLGHAVIITAWALALGHLLPWLGVLVYVVWISYFQIQREERLLARRFGAAYASYCTRVRRWV
ncbi:isoprenylcysteine carboxylmethyltransferase family protein [Oleiagrimonas sp. C23AA]|nr:isoprenylcysteine carboxylmethyltransferase family protein [Oleiagrimonas sp. C23AA]